MRVTMGYHRHTLYAQIEHNATPTSESCCQFDSYEIASSSLRNKTYCTLHAAYQEVLLLLDFGNVLSCIHNLQ